MQTTKTMPSKPSKQRKMIFKAPDHIRQKLFAAPLSPELRTTHKVKNLPVRSGDTIRIMRGDHKGFEGKVTRIDRNKYRIYVEGLTREKVDGTTIFVPIHPSKVMITKLNLDDKWRKQILERRKGVSAKVEEIVEKPPEKIVEEIVEPEKEAVAEKLLEKPKPKRRKRVSKKTPAKKAEKEAAKEEAPKEKKPRKTRTKRKSAKKTEGET